VQPVHARVIADAGRRLSSCMVSEKTGFIKYNQGFGFPLVEVAGITELLVRRSPHRIWGTRLRDVVDHFMPI
jgi:hypothetical protein